MLHTRAILLSCLFFFAIAIGCGKVNPLAPASISGGVTYKGKTVTGGSVNFFTPEGTPYSASIALDGTYGLSDLPTGEMIVVVETESVNPEHKAATGKDADRRNAMNAQRKGPNGQSPAPSGLEPKYVKIPEKYSKSKTSPLTVTVKSGRQVYNVELD